MPHSGQYIGRRGFTQHMRMLQHGICSSLNGTGWLLGIGHAFDCYPVDGINEPLRLAAMRTCSRLPIDRRRANDIMIVAFVALNEYIVAKPIYNYWVHVIYPQG